MPTYTLAEDSSDGRIETDSGSEGDAWDPEPCELREGEHSDVSGHAARNIALLREAEREGSISPAAARESIQRIREGGEGET